MFTDKETGKEISLDEAIEKIKTMTDEEKLSILDSIYKQLGIQPFKKTTL